MVQVLRMLFQHGHEGFQHHRDGFVKFRFPGIAALDGFEGVVNGGLNRGLSVHGELLSSGERTAANCLPHSQTSDLHRQSPGRLND